MKKVTAIIPLYNRAAFIDAALRSLIAQKGDCDLDIVVVNDGSSDDGPAIVEKLGTRHSGIRMVSTGNQGVAKARNVGLRQVPPDCEFVTFLDSDDVSAPNRLSTDLAVFDASPEIELTYGQLMMIDEIDPRSLAPAEGAQTAIVRGIHMGAAIFRKSLIDRVGFFDESLPQGEDTDFLMRAFESGATFRMTDTVTLYYRQHDGNMTRDRQLVVKYLLHALRRSILRRRNNPNARIPEELFDMKGLKDGTFEFDR